MIAGATGIDTVILVVDANEGWMPQTEEHFKIINLLNIKFGIIVISNVDLANKSQIAFVEEQIRKSQIARAGMNRHAAVDRVQALNGFEGCAGGVFHGFFRCQGPSNATGRINTGSLRFIRETDEV